MSNSWNVVDWLSEEALRLLTNKLACAQFMNTKWTKDYTQDFAVGETVRIPIPFRGVIRNGLGYDPQAIQRTYTTITVDQIFGYDFEWDDVEKALRVTRPDAALREQVIEPAVSQLAQEIDSRAALFAYQNANNVVGALGTDPTTTQFVMQARQRMMELAATKTSMKGMLIPPQVNTSINPALQALFTPDDEISTLFKEGSLGRLHGFKWYESMSLYNHTAGTWAGAVTLSSNVSNGDSTLSVTCTSGDTFKKGDKISIASVYAVNPATRRITTTAQTKQFTILADATGASSAAVLQVSPTIYYSGPNQNVSAQPLSGAALTLWPGTSSPNGKSGHVGLALTDEAFAMVGVKLDMPKAVELSSQRRDPDSGIYIRFVRAWDPIQSKMVNRFDIVLGFGRLYSDSCAVAIACA